MSVASSRRRDVSLQLLSVWGVGEQGFERAWFQMWDTFVATGGVDSMHLITSDQELASYGIDWVLSPSRLPLLSLSTTSTLFAAGVCVL